MSWSSLAPKTKTTTSGFTVAISLLTAAGQSYTSGRARPVPIWKSSDAEISGLPATFSENDSEMLPISESPASHTLSGCAAVGTRRAGRVVEVGDTAVGAVVGAVVTGVVGVEPLAVGTLGDFLSTWAAMASIHSRGRSRPVQWLIVRTGLASDSPTDRAVPNGWPWIDSTSELALSRAASTSDRATTTMACPAEAVRRPSIS